MSKRVNLYEAKTQLSRLVEQAAKGTEIVIAKNNKPVARLVALEKPVRSKKRRLGAAKIGLVEIIPREVADAGIEKEFEESKLWPDT